MKTSLKSLLLPLLTVAFFLPTGGLNAQTANWTNNGTDWNTGANWSTAAVPLSSEAAVFNTAVTQNPNLSSNATVLRVTTAGNSTAVGSFTLSSSSPSTALTLLQSATDVNAAINYSDNTGGTLTISAPIIFGNTSNSSQAIRIFNANATVSISGVISSTTTQGLIKNGAGTLILSGNNTYSGNTTIDGGVLRATTLANTGSNSSIGTNSTITINNTGTLEYAGSNNSTMNRAISLGSATGNSTIGVSNSTVTLTSSGVISGNGTLVKSGAGTLVLTSSTNNTYTGGTRINAGTLQGSTTSLQGNIINNGALVFNNNSTAGNYTGNISGNGSLTKTGAGAVTLLGSNSYTGGTIIMADSLIAGGNGSLGTGVLTFSNASSTARLNLNGFTNTVTGLTVSGAGLKVIQNEGASGSAGRLIVDLASGTDSSDANTIIRDRSSGSLGTLALTKNGAGTLDLSVINAGTAYSGGLTVNAGTLGFGVATYAVGNGTITLGGGSLRYTATGSSNSTLTNTFSLTSATNSSINVTDGTVALTLASAISGSGNLTKTGAGRLSLTGASANTNSGLTTVNDGKLQLNKTAGVNAIAGNLRIESSGTLLLSANNQVADTSNVTLSGGTIQRDSGITETFGNLDLTAASFINFGAGTVSSLNFGTYTGGGFKLNVNSFLIGNVLTFGTDLTSSINNTSLFGFDNAFTSNWNGSTFTITAVPEPSTLAMLGVALGGILLFRRCLRRGEARVS